ncbi:MAG: hypothetical protein QNJ44_02455 [Rhodobacter sp.]|nr:hypothetical protein [Rhodobacter sp.]
MSRPPRTVFLERRTYRRRRLADAARLLPVIGALLLLFPLLWVPDPDQPASTGFGGLYIFAVWAGLIVAAAWMSRNLTRSEPDATEKERSE